MKNSIHLNSKAPAVAVMVTVVMFVNVLLPSAIGQPTKAAPATGWEAGTNAPYRLSLAAAKEITLERNWDLLTARSGIDAATAQLIVAKEYPNPTASISLANFATHHIATIEGNGIWQRSYDTIFAVSQLIE